MKTYSKYDMYSFASEVKREVIKIQLINNLIKDILDEDLIDPLKIIEGVRHALELQKLELKNMINSLDLTIIRNK